jgi:hypothetical protein
MSLTSCTLFNRRNLFCRISGYSGFCLFSRPLKSTSLITVKCCFKLNTCSPNKQTNTKNVNKTRALPQTIIMCPTRKQHQCLTQFFFIITGETPYPDVRSQDLPNWLKQNKRNAKPEYCDDSYVLFDRKYSTCCHINCIFLCQYHVHLRICRGRDRMVVGFISTYAIRAYHH